MCACLDQRETNACSLPNTARREETMRAKEMGGGWVVEVGDGSGARWTAGRFESCRDWSVSAVTVEGRQG